MDTALITRIGADAAVLEKQRTLNDNADIYGIVDAWLWKEGTVQVKVEQFDSTDTCTHCWYATPQDDD